MSHHPLPSYDIFGSQHPDRLHPLYATMRAHHPIYRSQHPSTGRTIWFITSYESCVAMLRDQRLVKDIDNLPEHLRQQMKRSNAFKRLSDHMLDKDPPDHTRLRTLINKAFTPRMIQNLASRIETIADQLIDAMPSHGEIDLIKAYAYPLPIIIIAELIGIPTEDHHQFREWTETIQSWPSTKQVRRAISEFISYIDDLLDERLETPQDDLISELVQVQDDGEQLTRRELHSMLYLLVLAGHETITNIIGNGMLTLIQHYEQLATVRNNLDLLPSAIEEMMRFQGPVNGTTTRYVGEDFNLHGHQFKVGDGVVAFLLAANRDPAQFALPNTFDIERHPNKHIGFGNGLHYCLGAPLARLESQIAFQKLLTRIKNIELAVDPQHLVWHPSLVLHGMKQMPVRITT